MSHYEEISLYGTAILALQLHAPSLHSHPTKSTFFANDAPEKVNRTEQESGLLSLAPHCSRLPGAETGRDVVRARP